MLTCMLVQSSEVYASLLHLDLVEDFLPLLIDALFFFRETFLEHLIEGLLPGNLFDLEPGSFKLLLLLFLAFPRELHALLDEVPPCGCRICSGLLLFLYLDEFLCFLLLFYLSDFFMFAGQSLPA